MGLKRLKKTAALSYAHVRGAIAELRLAADLPAPQGSGKIETSCSLQSYSHETLRCYLAVF